MKQYNFDVNIEKRMPTTGKVFFVDRMTSDYAVAHPFNVDEFIESVCLKYEQLAQEDAAFFGGIMRDRNSLHQMWNKTMQMPVRGDASLYPNRDGRREPALMEVWSKAGDYWRCGFRQGDLLPAILPPCKITRTEDGWIALFPKDMQLLQSIQSEQPQEIQSIQSEPATPNLDTREEEQCLEVPCQAEIPQIETNLEEGSQSENQTEEDLKDSEGLPGETDSKRQKRQEPVQLDLFAQMQQEIAQLRREQRSMEARLTQQQSAADDLQRQNEALRRHNEQLQAEREATRQQSQAAPHRPTLYSPTPQPASRQQSTESAAPRVRTRQRSQWQSAPTDHRRSPQTATVAQPKREYPAWAKGLACMVAASVALVVIYNTGLLIPLGLIGLATSGLIK